MGKSKYNKGKIRIGDRSLTKDMSNDRYVWLCSMQHHLHGYNPRISNNLVRVRGLFEFEGFKVKERFLKRVMEI